jgi:hypothetical protein
MLGVLGFEAGGGPKLFLPTRQNAYTRLLVVRGRQEEDDDTAGVSQLSPRSGLSVSLGLVLHCLTPLHSTADAL